VKGSFTGAVRDRKGLFEEADRGTIFLDEIGDAPPPTQVAILRVLQTGEIRPVGAQKTRIVNVRVISATNKDLKKEIEAGNFREDLYYRLGTFVIDLPTLKERAEDIPLLARHTLARLCAQTGRDQLSVSPEAMELLMAYPWPGNVRQLENELERAAVVCDLDDGILLEHLSPELRNWTPSDPELRPYQGRLREIVERVEQDTIRSALAEHGGNILQTANDLGLTRKGLKDKMARYGIRADAARGNG
jgi:two-component system response regulator HupR/HoxA